MSGGSSQQQTTEANPWSEAAPYLKDVLGQAADVNREGGDFTREYQGLSDGQLGAIDAARKFYAPQGGYSNYLDTMRGTAMAMSDTNVANNPMVQAQMEANARNVQNNLLQNVLPGVTSGAVASGNRGSSRQGVAEGVAAGQAVGQLSDANTAVLNNAYSQALGDRRAAQQMLGQVADAEGNALNQVVNWENILQADEEARAETDWYNRNQAAYDRLGAYANLLYPAAGFGGMTTGTTTGNPARSPMGGALAGAGAGATFGPWGAAIGAGLGALSQA